MNASVAEPSSLSHDSEVEEEVFVFPASFAQQRLWFLDQLNPGQSTYNAPAAFRFSGPLDLELLEKALRGVVERHESLRTTFGAENGEPVQIVGEAGDPVISRSDLRSISASEKDLRVRAVIAEEVQQPFDLAKGPLLRTAVLRVADEEHIIVFNSHHIINDDWSVGVFLRDLKAFYEAARAGRKAELAELTIQYADFAVWQRDWVKGEQRDLQLAYWREKLAGAPVLELPTDRPRQNVEVVRGGMETFVVPGSLLRQLKELSKREGVTLFMTLLAAFKVLLYRYTAQTDLVIGSPISNRSRPEIEPLIGFFVNTLALRTSLDGELTFRELLIRVRDTVLDGFEHQDAPFEMLVEELQPERRLNQNPLCQAMFVLVTSRPVPPAIADLKLEPVEVEDTEAKFDLTINLIDVGGQLDGSLIYDATLFDRATIARMAGHFQELLASIVAAPHARIAELRILSERERHQLLVEWNAPSAESPCDLCLHELIEEQVERTPNAGAVSFGEERLTYRELNNRANQLAHRLQKFGVKRNVPVGIFLDRSLEMIISIFAVLKAGGAYLPLDPGYPRERLAFLIANAQVPVILTQPHLEAKLPAKAAEVMHVKPGTESTENLAADVAVEDIAYIIYTSGSTGQPKGTMIQHRAIGHHLQWMRAEFPLGDGARVLQKIPISFDASLIELFPPLICGGQLIVAPPEAHRDSRALVEMMARDGITNTTFVPAMLQMIISDPGWKDCVSLREVYCGGEPLPPETCARFYAAGEAQLVNFYGPTEFTIAATYHRCRAGETIIPIGRPVGNQRCYVLDAHRQLVPVGVPGELHLAGSQLAIGYLNNEPLTAEKFFTWNGERIYRTGDLVRWLPNGELDFIGRIDHQVKLRGFRIELGEIESALRRSGAVREVAVVLRKEKAEPYLAAYLVRQGETGEVELRDYLKSQLPDYMIPAAFVFLDALPLTANDKIDRKALPAPNRALLSTREFVTPETPLEQTLAGIWQELLGVEKVGALDNFFELGGHSLMAIRLISRLREALRHDLPLRAIFENQTLRELAIALEKIQTENREKPTTAEAPITHLASGAPSRLSFSQQRLWFLDRLYPDNSLYNVLAAWRVTGRVEVGFLEKALAQVLARHEVLRTVFREGVEGPEAVVVPLEVGWWAVGEMREEELPGRMREEAGRGFDLARGPLVRARWWWLGPEEGVLLLNVHHIVTDAWSQEIFLRELLAFYEAAGAGKVAALPELPIRYADFAHWQRMRLTGARLEEEMGYWRRQLAGLEPLVLPLDRARPVVTDFAGAMQSVQLPEKVTRALRELSQREGVSLFMTLLAVYQVLLARYSGEEQIAVGSVISNRSRVETEGLIGFFLNTLVLRTDLSGGPSFRELLGRVREVVLGAFAHQEIPFEMLVEHLQPARVANQNPLCQAAFTLLPEPEEVTLAGGARWRPLDIEESKAKFDLNLHLIESAGSVRGWLIYRVDLLAPATMARMAAHWATLAEELAAAPEQDIWRAPLLAPAERAELLYHWQPTVRPYPRTAALPELFAAVAAAHPQAVAVATAEQCLSYRELNERANQWARQLRARGVTRGTRVGLGLGRSPELIVALLAIVKAGGAYVPLDPAYPAARLAHLLAEAEVELILATAETAASWPAEKIIDLGDPALARHERSDFPSTLTGDDLAYVMFTSGTSGPPKGVAVTQRNVIRLVSETDYAHFGPDEIFLQLAPVSFDAATFEIWGPLLHGGQLIVPPPAPPTLEEIGALIRRHGVTTLWLTAGLFHAMVDERLADLRPLRQLLAGGDILSVPHVRRALAGLPQTQLINGYGPTETTTFACCHPLTIGEDLSDSVPIGRSIAHSTAYLLDPHQQPVPIGITGELYLGGDGVARGYLQQPGLTAERFLPDPFQPDPGARMYRTGDLARWRADGRLIFLGRRDQQVKIRGYRIEPGEIESALRALPPLLDAAVLVHPRPDGDKQLLAYIVARPGPPPTPAALRLALQKTLPDYMIPSAFLPLAALPLTANGKLDRHALPTPESLARVSAEPVAEPRDQVELKLLKIWENALQRHPIGIRDNFFALGGHSLLAVRIFSQIERQLGRNLPLATLFSSPTIEQLAEVLRSENDQNAWASLVPIQPHGTRPPFFCLHGGDGGVIFHGELANTMDRDIPVFGLQAQGLDGGKVEQKTVEELAASYIREIKSVQPSGPYHFGGYCFGGVIAFEMARQIEAAGEKVGLVALFDTVNPSSPPRRYRLEERVAHRRREIQAMSLPARARYLFGRAIGKVVANYNLHFERVEIAWSRLLTRITGRVPVKYRALAVRQAHLRALRDYRPQPFPGRLTLFRARDREDGFEFDPHFGWEGLAAEIDAQDISGSHATVFKQPHVHEMAGFLNERLRAAHRDLN